MLWIFFLPLLPLLTQNNRDWKWEGKDKGWKIVWDGQERATDGVIEELVKIQAVPEAAPS